MNKLILPICYLPPVSWFAALDKAQADGLDTYVEYCEHFPKQTYRNRANILCPNGVLPLSVPVVKGAKNHTKMKDVKISYEYSWQKTHWKSLESSYRSSAFFEYFEDDFAPFYEKKETFLIDFNLSLLELANKCLKITPSLQPTTEYRCSYPDDCIDLRELIHPKKDSLYTTDAYYQVFAKEQGFFRDLSIVDLLFNHGRNSLNILNTAQLTASLL